MGGELFIQAVKTCKCKQKTRIWGAYSGGAGDVLKKVVGGPCIPVVLSTSWTFLKIQMLVPQNKRTQIRISSDGILKCSQS